VSSPWPCACMHTGTTSTNIAHSRLPVMLSGQEADLAKIKARMEEMEAEAAKLKMMQEKQKEALDAGASCPPYPARS
jgi:hypothetical protein